ncbi:MAG: hypothetical protein IKI49_00770 [Oscillospiraceae bacterium]|nr:hypothetical protein [Oscillospiraceae bacterium]
MINIDSGMWMRALNKMGRKELELARKLLEMYKRTGEDKYLLQFTELISNFDDDEAVRIRRLVR